MTPNIARGGRSVSPISSREAQRMVIKNHYLHRRAPITHAFGLIIDGVCFGVVTFGTPASRHMLLSACPQHPENVIELNRLWVCDSQPRNTESWFLARALRMLPPKIVLSYADTAVGHRGYIYRAANFFYAGWTDMDRKSPRVKSPRVDYITDGKHSRATFRNGDGLGAERIPRKPKVRYWTVSGTRGAKKKLRKLCAWPKLDWRTLPPPVGDLPGGITNIPHLETSMFFPVLDISENIIAET